MFGVPVILAGMSKDTGTSAGYCRSCDYDLRGLPEKHRCPECGREFDLADPRSFRKKPRRGVWRILRWVVYPVLLILLVCAGGVGWTYWEWKREQPMIAWVNENNRHFVQSRLIGPEWVQKHSGRWKWMLERADRLSLGVWNPEELPVEHGFSRLNRLTELTLRGEELMDDRWAKELRGMKELGAVYLDGPGVGDESVKILGNLKELRIIRLWNTRVSGRGLSPLLGLPKLERLELWDTPADDSAVSVLKVLTKLEILNLQGTKITQEGVDELRKALPNCVIVGP